MAIVTLNDALAGMRQPVPIIKSGATMASPGAQRGYTPWYVGANPPGSTATSVGVNGEAVTPALASAGGAILRVNPSGGSFAYMSRFSLAGSIAGTVWLIDRVWQNSGLNVTSTTAQAITPATIPARDRNGSTNGEGIMAGIEWSAAGGAGTPTVTLTYTASDGTTGRTGTFSGVGSPPVGTFEIFSLQGSDKGVRAPTSFIQSATRTSGTMHLVLFRVIAQVETVAAGIAGVVDALTSGFPRIYDDSTLQLLWFPSSTTAVNLVGTYSETHG